jgi:hypothetical protein
MLCDVAWAREQNLGCMLFADDVLLVLHPRAVAQMSAPVAPGEPAEPSEVIPAKEADLMASIREAATSPTCGRCGYWRPDGGGQCDFLGMGSAASEKACTAFSSRKG